MCANELTVIAMQLILCLQVNMSKATVKNMLRKGGSASLL